MDDAKVPDASAKEGTGSAGPWLGGVRSAAADLGPPGERLGLPGTGPGSLAGYGRRLGALFIDWVVALLTVSFIAAVAGWRLSRGNLWPLAAFGVETWLLTALLGLTVGKRLLGLRVLRLDGRPVGPLWALVRTALLLTVVPALLWDRDYRGLHDKAAHTVVVRS
jgi:uncharacterized RDD family membrane protein YckC